MANEIKDLKGFIYAVENKYYRCNPSKDEMGLAFLYYSDSVRIIENEIKEADYIKQWREK